MPARWQVPMPRRKTKPRLVHVEDSDRACGHKGCTSPLSLYRLHSPYRSAPGDVWACSRAPCIGSVQTVARTQGAEIVRGEPKPRSKEERQGLSFL